jgi:hypothetical protein
MYILCLMRTEGSTCENELTCSVFSNQLACKSIAQTLPPTLLLLRKNVVVRLLVQPVALATSHPISSVFVGRVAETLLVTEYVTVWLQRLLKRAMSVIQLARSLSRYVVGNY